MIEILVAVVPLAVLLVLSEMFWRAKVLRGEAARKMLHIIIGSYVASWPYFVSFRQIQLIALAMFAGVVLSHKFHIFHAINDVKRKTWGDMLYAVGVGVTAALAREPWVFALAILHMSVADGLAGLAGSCYGKNTEYKVFGNKKSLIGTFVFTVVSFALLTIFAATGSPVTFEMALILPPVLAVIENIGIRGADNILVPALVALFFR